MTIWILAFENLICYNYLEVLLQLIPFRIKRQQQRTERKKI